MVNRWYSYLPMDKLIRYYRSLQPDEKIKLAESCNTSYNYITKTMCLLKQGKKIRFGKVICEKIEEFSGGYITRQYLRPDDWRKFWSDLKE